LAKVAWADNIYNMISTRDFLLFSVALLFLLTAIVTTLFTNSFSQHSMTASVINFAPPSYVSGAETTKSPSSNEDNITRLKAKIAAGEGDVAIGEPVFTSVDDVEPSDTEPQITDQTPPSSIQIGSAMDGSPLYSTDMWRFVGYSQNEQIGIAINGTAIFGSRTDALPLDECGGVDDGSGYKFFLSTNNNVNPNCYGQ